MREQNITYELQVSRTGTIAANWYIYAPYDPFNSKKKFCAVCIEPFEKMQKTTKTFKNGKKVKNPKRTI